MNTLDSYKPPPILLVDRLKVDINTGRGTVSAVSGVSFSLEKGESLGIVGESGCGKTILCKSILGLLPARAKISHQSEIVFNGRMLNRFSNSEYKKIRGHEVAMIFQDPMTALNPVMTIGRQVAEPMVHHLGMSWKDALEKSKELVVSVGISKPSIRLRQFPHELSGGLRQRVVIAIALSCNPKLLIADEPTTALDVTVQAEILDLLDYLRKEKNMAMILVTHDLGVAAARCRDIAVMYAGRFVETAPAKTLFSHMKMPYTRALFDSLPRLDNRVHSFLKTINGQPPDLVSLPEGCCFSPRCPHALDRCFEEAPRLLPKDHNAHRFACWYPLGSACKT